MNSVIKIVIHIKDVDKPIVLSCSQNETKENIIHKIKMFKSGQSDFLQMDSGDVLLCDPNDVKSILITTDKQ